MIAYARILFEVPIWTQRRHKVIDFYSNFFLIDIDEWYFQFYELESKEDKTNKTW